ncbi:MAG: Asp-tRNA(Asn)/Glu-tRNA(Gln) amidotransferase subunit GatC [Candidatus Caenarcaniphilales bacterium]|jgi:aspartyl-tRNA(Asn)/glutamyl-tRNA(Gln) amidotransferase subunit C|nr:Asp-tRNA(Asn)/Glu-tRNA(Gln) amidotransferase subunit GatC [Candidatus Caenarcaniphilales bacterium]
MSLNHEQVKHIAKLARLNLTEDEVAKYALSLSQILGYIEQLNELDTKDVEPMIAAVQHQKALREDIAVDSQLQESMLANAPAKEETAIKIPQMS